MRKGSYLGLTSKKKGTHIELYLNFFIFTFTICTLFFFLIYIFSFLLSYAISFCLFYDIFE